jgi:hypothetical protein
VEPRPHFKKRIFILTKVQPKKIMKKIILTILVSASLLSCKDAADSSKSADQNPLSGTFTERDDKAKTMYNNLTLFAKADFSYVKETLSPEFTIKNSGDTAVAAKGHEGVIAYWQKLHTLFKDISFSEGRVHTFYLNNGEVYSAYFGEITSTGKITNKTFTSPIQIWDKWEGNKITSQMDMVDMKKIFDEAAAAPAASAAPSTK